MAPATTLELGSEFDRQSFSAEGFGMRCQPCEVGAEARQVEREFAVAGEITGPFDRPVEPAGLVGVVRPSL